MKTALQFAGVLGAIAIADGKLTPEEATSTAKQAIALQQAMASEFTAQGVTDEVQQAVANRLIGQALRAKGFDVAKAAAFAVKCAVKLCNEVKAQDAHPQIAKPEDIV